MLLNIRSQFALKLLYSNLWVNTEKKTYGYLLKNRQGYALIVQKQLASFSTICQGSFTKLKEN